MIDWAECRLADACQSIDYGFTAAADSEEVGPKFLRITDIAGGHIDWSSVPYVAVEPGTFDKYQLHNGDIVLARTGASTGASCYIKEPPPSVFASYLVRLQVKPEFDARFVAYYLKSEAFGSFIRGVLGDRSAQPNASASTMTKAPFKFPRDLDEQRRIAHILGTLDDKIELNRRMNETLEAIARAIFKSWFVDFDPVRAKSSGQDIDLPPHIADLFPDHFEASELGEIPAGWVVKTVASLADIVGGSTPSTTRPEFWEQPAYAWATPKDLAGLRTPVLLRTARQISNVGLAQISSGLLPIGTVLLSSRAPIGYVAVAEVPTAINQGFIALRPHSNVSNLFLMFWILSAMEQIKSVANGSTFMEVSKSSFRTLALVAPPEDLHQAFTQRVRPLYDKIVQNEVQTVALEETRALLLPELMSGRVSGGLAL